jgi:DGQHR domain-containing protein
MKTTYEGLKVKQRSDGGPTFVLFSATAEEILSWASIDTISDDDKGGPQRIEKPFKTKAIAAYFNANSNNTIPTSVIIGFRTGQVNLSAINGSINCINIEIDDSQKGTIVDGQHRVLGVKSFNSSALINVVGLLDVDDTETAFQFLVINNKVSRVSSDHLRALALHYSEDELADRLKKVKLNLNPNLRFVGFANDLDGSPFKGLLALPTNPENCQIVTPAAIEDSINFIRSQKLSDLVEDDDMVTELFFTIWRTIRETWPELWVANSRLLSKASVVCVSQFIVQHLLRQFDWTGLDIFDPDVVEKEVKRILGALDRNFWSSETEWTAKGLDTQAGRKILLDSLEQIVRNFRQGFEWHTDVSMVRFVAAD